ncbi:2-oxoglutarate and Fe(II)-dependent oxygenase superfamily protein isoform 1 [Hibiscus syriacus]|uniref:2-oxoglutarate and Fe(II)-dependent oxygenase superfamily protein isoform 1 n=1 Tax=Hibiscus syriacus TaxID=106335 RepID=A0A6A2X1A7_HIBSY|nr:2-oxoglutarate and Fe(II)-dependent oxygenase superfamily protein isoform 1 [Hibiscus syriacus]
MSDQTKGTPPSNDPYKLLEISLNPDGSLKRNPNRFSNTPATPDQDQPVPVLSKDITINQSKSTWARIFLPRQQLLGTSNKLPVIVYFHGGGFIQCSVSTTGFHVFCSNMALQLRAIVVSVDYRLAPEHRLPAAYDDSVEALYWIKTTQEEWLKQYMDFNTCSLMGTSSGGNIVYHAGVSDLSWELALPIGADRDHEYCNPTSGKGPTLLENLASIGWRVLVTGCDGDPLIDRQVGLVKLMEEKGVKVVSHFRAGEHHGVDVSQPAKAEALFLVLKDFISSAS